MNSLLKNTLVKYQKLYKRINIYGVLKRTMWTGAHKTSKALTTVNCQRGMHVSLHAETPVQDLLEIKQAAINFCEHFKDLDMDKNQQNALILQALLKRAYFDEHLLMTRIFQIALEVAYAKRPFLDQEVENAFRDSVKTRNILEGVYDQQTVDQSTIYNRLLVPCLKKSLPYDTELILNQTPRGTYPKDLPFNIKTELEVSKALTGNTFADIMVDGRYYDFKMTKRIELLNHIYTLAVSENSIKKFKACIYNLSKSSSDIHIRQKAKALHDILQESSNTQTAYDCVQSWNKFVITHGRMYPKTRLPLFTMPASKPFIPHKEYTEACNSIELPQGTINYPRVKSIIIAITGKYPTPIQQAISVATRNNIVFEEVVD